MDGIKDEYGFPKPFSDEVWRMIIFNSQNPPGVCMSLMKLAKNKIDDLNMSLAERDWRNSASLLSELKKAEEFISLCESFIKK